MVLVLPGYAKKAVSQLGVGASKNRSVRIWKVSPAWTSRIGRGPPGFWGSRLLYPWGFQRGFVSGGALFEWKCGRLPAGSLSI